MLRLAIAQVVARIGGVRQRVVAVVRHRHVARTEFGKAGKPAQVGADRETVLDRRHDRQHAVALRRLDLVGGHGERHGDAGVGATTRLAHRPDRQQHRFGAFERRRLAGGGARGLRHIGGEEPGGDAATPHLRQVDVPRSVLERIGTGRPGDVDMRVERQQAMMQCQRVGGEGCVHVQRFPQGERRQVGQVGGKHTMPIKTALFIDFDNFHSNLDKVNRGPRNGSPRIP